MTLAFCHVARNKRLALIFIMKGAVTEPELCGKIGNRSKPETGKTGNRANRKLGARYQIPASQPESWTGTGCRVPDTGRLAGKPGREPGPGTGYRPASQKAGPGPDYEVDSAGSASVRRRFKNFADAPVADSGHFFHLKNPLAKRY